MCIWAFIVAPKTNVDLLFLSFLPLLLSGLFARLLLRASLAAARKGVVQLVPCGARGSVVPVLRQGRGPLEEEPTRQEVGPVLRVRGATIEVSGHLLCGTSVSYSIYDLGIVSVFTYVVYCLESGPLFTSPPSVRYRFERSVVLVSFFLRRVDLLPVWTLHCRDI